jgi:hypothetical protein
MPIIITIIAAPVSKKLMQIEYQYLKQSQAFDPGSSPLYTVVMGIENGRNKLPADILIANLESDVQERLADELLEFATWKKTRNKTPGNFSIEFYEIFHRFRFYSPEKLTALAGSIRALAKATRG